MINLRQSAEPDTGGSRLGPDDQALDENHRRIAAVGPSSGGGVAVLPGLATGHKRQPLEQMDVLLVLQERAMQRRD